MLSERINTLYDRGRQTIESWLMAYIYAEEERSLTNSEVMPRKKPLIDVYEHVMLDLSLTTAVESRKNRIIGEDWRVLNADGTVDKKATKTVNSLWFIDTVKYLLESFLFGYTLLEWHVKDGRVYKTKTVERRNVVPERNLVLERPFDNHGINFNAGRYANRYHLVHHGLGLLLKIAPVVLYKRYGLAAWVEGAEGFGMPLVNVKTNKQDKDERKRIVDSVLETRSERVIVSDLTEEVQVFQMGHTDAHQIYDGLVRLCNEEIIKSVLMGTLISDAGASHAQSLTHENNLSEAVESDKTWLTTYVEELIFPKLISIGHTEFAGGKTFDIQSRPKASYVERSEAIKNLAVHYDISKEEIIKQLGIEVGDAKVREVNQYSGVTPSQAKSTGPKRDAGS